MENTPKNETDDKTGTKTDNAIAFTARYLKILGIVQIVALNILFGVLWFVLSDGIKQKKKDWRTWILIINLFYLACLLVAIIMLMVAPERFTELGSEDGFSLELPSMFWFCYFGIYLIIYAIPTYLLCRKDVSAAFLEEEKRRYEAEERDYDDPL